jgi:uncharacterized repeat protein (TIGR01451 family)
MKTSMLSRIINFLGVVICLALVGLYLIRGPFSLPETAGRLQSAPARADIVSAADLGFIGPAAPLTAEEVLPFVKTLHIHGIPYEPARQFGPEAVPLLLKLLADPAEALYTTNVVVTLGFIGHPSARQPLLDYLTQTRGQVSLDQFRALRAVPFALSQLAHQGDGFALAFLIQASEQRYWQDQPLPWTFNGQPPAQELYQQTLLGLGLSGLPQAQTRLQEIAGRGNLSAQAEHEVLQQALALNQQVQQQGMAPVVSPDPNTIVPSQSQRQALGPQAADTNANSHLQTFTIARYTSLSTPTNAQVDTFLTEASRIMQTIDSGSDVGCCVALQRNGSITPFNTTDGTITTNAELNAVFGVTAYQVKIVPALDYCGGFNASIIGCAFIGSPKNMVLEYLGSTSLDAILWAHEFGHNQGLQHPDPVNNALTTRIMNGRLDPQAKQMTQTECNAWHSTFSNPGTVSGPCPLLFAASKNLEATSVVTSGATITYVITVVNNTFNPITGITISDSLPGQLSYVSGSASANPPIVNLTNFPTSTGSFTLNSNSSVQITYQALVGAVSSKETFINVVTVSAAGLAQPLQASSMAIVDAEKSYLPLLFK